MSWQRKSRTLRGALRCGVDTKGEDAEAEEGSRAGDEAERNGQSERARDGRY
jgi:hypothetical protein